MGACYAVFEVSAADLLSDEALGTKPKFWFARDKERWLFKEARQDTGEDWAEKIAAELAKQLAIKAAVVELAQFGERRGCASRSFVDTNVGESLIHGNEILAGMVIGYDPKKTFGQSDHTLENIHRAITKLFPRKRLHAYVLTSLATYLVFDALIANTDRHHENWGLLLQPPRPAEESTGSSAITQLSVAPTFDHASSLGRELQDARRKAILENNGIERYLRKGRGGVYLKDTDPHGANPLQLVEYGFANFGEFFSPALRKLAATPLDRLIQAIEPVPEDRMSAMAKSFCREVISCSYRILGSLVK